jgi:ankyrin repeat protein
LTSLAKGIVETQAKQTETVTAGADPNKKDLFGNTALMKTAKRGDKGEVEILLKAGADPNILVYGVRGDWSALRLARSCGDEEISEILEKAEAKK